ncbi:unnamed protein product [Caenorhabditis auriculariae]|uniref:Suppressor of Ty 6 homolog n=1 Tax=Caenorhabditis auriculariae TaxID=2777116 RepID=A0A8S1HA35_9PELO|nr:unnamed protein product [Caenorhabditis auriculariae]
MDFLDNQAEESEGEESSNASGSDDEPRMKKRKTSEKKKKKTKKIVESDDDDDDEDDDDEEGREEMKGFIADEEEEEEDDAKSEKSAKEDIEDELDDDDLDLINENLDRPTDRTQGRVQLDDSDDDDIDDRTAIQNTLFGGGDDDAASERGGGGNRQRERGDYSENEYSDSERSEDNFIEDDGDRPARQRHRNRNANMPEGAAEDARDVFGVEDFNFDEFYEEEDGDEAMDDEEEEIIEDDGEGGEIRVGLFKRFPRESDANGNRRKSRHFLDSIEPSELEKGFLTAHDKKIMIEDTPERFQLRRTPVTECDEEELGDESEWIFNNAFGQSTISRQERTTLPFLMNEYGAKHDSSRAQVINVIREVLRFIRLKTNCFEVPFIHFYRKEYINKMLTIDDLWRVYDFDEKWCHLTNRKKKLSDLMTRMQRYQDESEDLMVKRRPISDYDIMEVKLAGTMEQLTDIHSNFQLLHGPYVEQLINWEKERKVMEGEEVGELKTRFKASNRNDKYHLCVENGIGELVGRFGLTAKQFAENLEWKKHEVEQESDPPGVVAQEYITSAFPSVEVVLEGAKYMLAREISRLPLVREKVRKEYRNKAMVWVRPTKKGRDTLDESHPIWEKRYIKEKQVTQLSHEDFLYYHLLKETGLLEIIIDCDTETDRETGHTLVNSVLSEKPFHKDEYTESVEQWNALRDECSRMAIEEMLIPYIKEELYNTLLEEAKQSVIRKCTENLSQRLSRAGYKPPPEEIDEDDDTERHGHVRIMAIVYPTEREEASFGIMVDENGRRPESEAQSRIDGLFQKKFVTKRRPHAIALNAEDMEAIRLKRDLEDAINSLVETNAIPRRIEVFLIDCDASKVFMRSNTAALEHPDYPPALRQAVSLARLLLDPVPEYGHLWNSDEDFFCMAFHPLQRDVNQEELSNALLHQFMNRVNEIGVDINKCIEFPHYTNLLQFVAGLGPRKATQLLKIIKQNDNMVESRTKLVTGCKLGPKIFMNCSGFLKIDTFKIGEKTEAYVEVLDGSRVHPETYEWARKMAVDALEVDESADPTTALMEIMETPDRLKDLDLDAFAEELNRQGFGEKKATLYDISSELTSRYKDNRPPFEPLDNEKLFDLLTKSGKPLKEGQRVMGTVVAVQYKRNDVEQDNCPVATTDGNNMFRCPNCKEFTTSEPAKVQSHLLKKNIRDGGCPGTPVGVKVRLDNGVMGFVRNKDISKDNVDNPLKRVKINQPYYFKVLKIEKDRFSALLSCKSSDLQAIDEEIRDTYWDEDAHQMDIQETAADALKKKEEGTRVKRVISHPNFHNISFDQARKLLDSLDWSECVIRPSAHQDSSLSVTWKISDRVYHNFFVKESQKEQVFSLGRQLIVGNEEFEDLNELVARFVQPMIQNSHEITTHKYFYNGAVAEEIPTIEAYVHKQKIALGRLPYVFTASLEKPCTFFISYMFDHTNRIRHEYFTIHPGGIRFRHQTFQSLDHMLAFFKKHFNTRPPDPRQSTHSIHNSFDRPQIPVGSGYRR